MPMTGQGSGQVASEPFTQTPTASRSEADVFEVPLQGPTVPGVPQVPGIGAHVWDWSSAAAVDPELYWATRFWVPLDEEGYRLLAFVASLDSSLRRRAWAAKWRNRSVNDSVLGFDPNSWGLSGTARPAFIPTLVQRGFEAHQALHRTLTPESWMRLKTIGRQSFVQCGLAYVELGAIISGYFEYPYGIIDERVYRAVRDMMFVKDAKYNTSPRDVKSQMQMTQTRMRRCHWIVGCLLQHAGADTTRLAQFCIKELEYNPRSCTQYPLLQCLAPQVRVFCTEKDTPERLSILEAILAKLPVVSAKEYAQLTQDQLNDDMRQTAALEPLIQKDWDKASAECEPAEVDFTAGVGSEQHQGHRYPTCSRGVVDQNPLSRKRQIPQECSHLTKKKGTEGGSGSIFGEVDQCVSGAWTQPAAVLPAADVPVVAVSIAGNVSHPGCVLPRDRVATQFFYEMSQQPSTSPAIQQLERLVNHDQGSVVDDAFVNAFAEAVWKEYGPLLSPPMDHLMADVNDLPYEPACKSPWA